MDKTLKKQSMMSIIISIVSAIFGIILIANPSESLNIISIIMGIGLILIGIYKIIDYYTLSKNIIYNYNNIHGIISVILGIVTIICKEEVSNMFRIILGLWIIYSSLIKISLAFKFKRADVRSWIYLLICSIIMLICGLFIVFNKGTIMIVMGSIILINSIINIVEELVFQKNINEIKKYFEVK